MRITHNLIALNALNNIKKNNKITSKSIEKLSSGLRINKAADDAAGLSISEKMRAQIRGLKQAERNVQDGISLIQTADAGLSNILQPPLQRMRELAIQAMNDTLTDEDRQKIQLEIEQMKNAIDDIANNTEFNGIKLLTTYGKVSQNNPGLDIQFNVLNSGTDAHLTGISWNGSRYVAIGTENTILTSIDGISWTKSNPEKIQSVKAITSFGDKFIIVGDSWGIETSSDGINWTNQRYGGAHYLFSIATNGINQIITGGNGGYWTSTDGHNWVSHNLNIFDVYSDIVWAGDKFVVAKNAEPWQISWTDDLGITWHNITLPESSYPNAITYGNGLIVTAGLNGKVSISNNANDWITIQTPTNEDLYDIIWDGNYFLACGANGTFITSADGITWNNETNNIPTSETLMNLTFSGDKYIIVGLNGLILEGINVKNEIEKKDISKSLFIQVGANPLNNLYISLGDVNSEKIGVKEINVLTQKNTNKTILAIDSAIEKVTAERSKLGAYQNALEHIYNNLLNSEENLAASESRIRDADIAKEVINFVKSNILQQTSQAVLAQANQIPETVIQLLK